jgi:hypothetical protein
VVAICTRGRREQLEEILAARRPSGEPAGAWVWLDAEETLDAFMSCGRFDRATARETVMPILEAASAEHEGTRVYGEMAGLAWEAGYVSAAIELEGFWNELKRELPFSLFCSYAIALVSGPEHGHEFALMQTLHSEVVEDGLTLDIAGAGPAVVGDFPPAPEAPRRARQLVRAALARTCQQDVSEVADLVVSELATNAVIHVVSPFSVTARIERGLLRLEVGDAGSLTTATRERLVPEPAHGLGIVDALCSDWGFGATTGGKVVWAELELDADGAGAR